MTLHAPHRCCLLLLSMSWACAAGDDPRVQPSDAEAATPNGDASAPSQDASEGVDAAAEDAATLTGVPDWSARWLFPATPASFRVFGDALYWAQAGEGGRIVQIMRRPVEGAGAPTQVVAPMGTAPAIGVTAGAAFITTTSGRVYAWDFMSEPVLLVSTLAQTASEILMESGGLILVSSSGYYRVAIDGAGAAVESSIGGHPVEGPDGVYWIDQTQGQLMRFAAGSSTPVGLPLRGKLGAVTRHDEELLLIHDEELLAFDGHEVSHVADISGDGPMWADGDHVFWIDARRSSKVFRVDRRTGRVETVFAPAVGSLLRCFATWKTGVIVTGENGEGEPGFWWLHPTGT